MLNKPYLIAALTFLQISFTVKAQDNFKGKNGNLFQFASTRPSFAEGNLLVPKGKGQIEMGTAYTLFLNERQEITHPSLQIKYGVSNYFELRLSGSAMTVLSPDANITGIPPITFGLKVKMLDAKKNATGASFIGV